MLSALFSRCLVLDISKLVSLLFPVQYFFVLANMPICPLPDLKTIGKANKSDGVAAVISAFFTLILSIQLNLFPFFIKDTMVSIIANEAHGGGNAGLLSGLTEALW